MPSYAFEGSSTTTASADQVWTAWTDPSRWAGGPIVSAELVGAFALGSRITTKVEGFPIGTSEITRIDVPKAWTSVAKSRGFTMTYDHLIEERDGGCVLTERATITGLLAPVIASLVGRKLTVTFGRTTAHCAALAEAGS